MSTRLDLFLINNEDFKSKVNINKIKCLHRTSYFFETEIKLKGETIRDFEQSNFGMKQAKSTRLAESEILEEETDTTMEPRWDNLPYPVIQTIAKENLQIVKYAQH